MYVFLLVHPAREKDHSGYHRHNYGDDPDNKSPGLASTIECVKTENSDQERNKSN
jgi:hypothetical protein